MNREPSLSGVNLQSLTGSSAAELTPVLAGQQVIGAEAAVRVRQQQLRGHHRTQPRLRPQSAGKSHRRSRFHINQLTFTRAGESIS